MYLPKTPNPRNEFLLAYSTTFFSVVSGLYVLMLLWGYVSLGSEYNDFPPLVGFVVFGLALYAYVLNKKKYTSLSFLVLTTTILTSATLAGIWWGFDLPSVLLAYVASIAITATIADGKTNIRHIGIVLFSICLGQIYRVYATPQISWHAYNVDIDDIVEFSIMLGFIAMLLILSKREQEKLLTRTTRSEFILKKERDELERVIEKRTQEIKKIQMDHIVEMYRFVEFGKISSGLFHDLMSPIQTLKLYIESYNSEDVTTQAQFARIQKISLKIEHMLEAMRTHIRIDAHVETFDVLSDIRDIIQMTQYIHVKYGIHVEIVSLKDVFLLKTKRTVLNHVLLNLVSNACEACIPRVQDIECSVRIHVGTYPGHSSYTHYIAVEDTGVGIDTAHIKRIFDPFYSSKKDTTQSINCGVGLSSAKHSVEKQLEGKLFVESELGVGTTMTIVF